MTEKKKIPRRMDGYLRVSRRMGREGPGYISPDVQREAIQRWADYRGVEVAAWHLDEDESGGTQDRPGIREAMRRVQDGETDGIACWRLNRFARNVSEALRDVERVQAAGGSLAFVEEDIDPTGPFGEFILTILLAVAALELNNIKASWRTAKTRSNTRGAKLGPTPWGYERAVDGTLVEHPTVGPLVRAAFTRAADAGHHAALALLREQAPTKPWTTTTLRRLLGNRVYLGETVLHLDKAKGLPALVARGTHEPLTDGTTWERAQLAPGAVRERALAYPLSGLAECATCGGPMVGARGGANVRNYRCRAGLTTWRGERCPGPAMMMSDRLEGYVWECLLEAYRAASRPRAVQAGAESGDALAGLEEELEAAEREVARFAGDVVAAEALGEDVWQAALTARAARVTAAREALAAAGADLRRPALLPTLAALEGLEEEERGEVLRGSGVRAVVTKGRGRDVSQRVRVYFDEAQMGAGLAGA